MQTQASKASPVPPAGAGPRCDEKPHGCPTFATAGCQCLGCPPAAATTLVLGRGAGSGLPVREDIYGAIYGADAEGLGPAAWPPRPGPRGWARSWQPCARRLGQWAACMQRALHCSWQPCEAGWTQCRHHIDIMTLPEDFLKTHHEMPGGPPPTQGTVLPPVPHPHHILYTHTTFLEPPP